MKIDDLLKSLGGVVALKVGDGERICTDPNCAVHSAEAKARQLVAEKASNEAAYSALDALLRATSDVPHANRVQAMSNALGIMLGEVLVIQGSQQAGRDAVIQVVNTVAKTLSGVIDDRFADYDVADEGNQHLVERRHELLPQLEAAREDRWRWRVQNRAGSQ